MSDFIFPARRPASAQGVPARDDTSALTMSPTGPLRPEIGTPLDMLLRRQTLGAGASALLAYVPAQVR